MPSAHRTFSLAASALLLGALAFLPTAAGAREPAGCTAIEVQSRRPTDLSSANRVELPSGAVTSLGRLDYRVNALGYAKGQNLAYGLADFASRWPTPGAPRVITIARDGTVRDLGPIHRGPHQGLGPMLLSATAGSIVGNRWYIKRIGTLYTVDVDPASATYLSVVHVSGLRPLGLAAAVDDFDLDPVSGLLVGVAADAHDPGSLVSLDPVSGAVRRLPGPKLPPSSAYGAVVAMADGTLSVLANDVHGHSRRYLVPPKGVPVEIATGPELSSSDGAGCFTAPPPPPPPPPTTPPTTPPPPPPPPPPPTTPPPTTPPSSTTVTPPPPPPPPKATPPPSPVPVPPPAVEPEPVTPTPEPSPRSLPTAEPVAPVKPAKPSPRPTTKKSSQARPTPSKAADAGPTRLDRTKEKRRWGVAVLLMTIGAAAVTRTAARHRSR